MAGLIHALARFTIVITTRVLSLARQIVYLWAEKILNSTQHWKQTAVCCKGSYDLSEMNKYLCSLDELLSGSFLILFMSSPGSERRCLQGSTKGKRHDPGFGQRAVVDGIEVDRGLLFTLTAWEKSYSCRTQHIQYIFIWLGQTLFHIVYVGLPGTAGGTVRRKAVTVAMATSSGLYLMGQLCPAVTMLGLRSVPSRYTWWSDMALYTAARTWNPHTAVFCLTPWSWITPPCFQGQIYMGAGGGLC